MTDCVFCKIIAGEIPAEIKYQDEKLIAFPDIHPQAPIHILIVTRKHIPSLNELTVEEESLIGDMIHVARQLAVKEGIAEKGYRVVINTGVMGGQAIPHLHMHLLGGRQFRA
jgi:histidine triad (HIT) family protein